MPDIPYIGGAYTARSLNINAQECVNLYPETEGEGGKNVAALVGTPGLKLYADLGTGRGVMGLHADCDTLYAVSDNKFYSISANKTITHRGTLDGSGASRTNRVHMAHNPYQVMVVDGTSDGYIYEYSTAALSRITDTDFPGALNVTFQDGYFVVTKPDTDEFYISALNEGKSWDALDFASAEGSADMNVAVVSDHRELWIFGRNTIEVWYNSGDVTFPFERVQGGFQETGCIATASIAKADNSLFWLGRDERGDGVVYRADGYTPRRVSTHAIEKAIQGYSTTSDAFAYTYQQEGHLFYVLTFPTANVTWCYDVSTNLWHRRSYYDGKDDNRHRSNCFAYYNGKLIVGDHTNGLLYELDLDTYTDNGEEIRRIRTAYHIHNDRKRSICNRFEIDMEFGVGLNTGQGSNPQIALQVSKDGGHTFGNELWRSMGSLGTYAYRAIWQRLGVSRTWTMRTIITDPVKVVLIAAKGDFEGCDH